MQRSHLLVTILVLSIGLLVFLLQPRAHTNNPIIDSLAQRKLLYERDPMLQKLVNSKPTYKAPLHFCDLQSRVPDSYVVFLHIGHGLETHKKIVGNGVDWDNAIQHVFEEPKHYELYYSAKLDEEALMAIRADIGVDKVKCNLYAELFTGRLDEVIDCATASASAVCPNY